MKHWIEKHRSEFQGEVYFEEPLSKHTYYKIGGPAEVLCVPQGLKDLEWISRLMTESHPQFFVLGLGSNVLASDSGFRGLVIKTQRLNLAVEGPSKPPVGSAIEVRTGASVPNSTLLRKAALEGWAGLEFLTGVPGTTGGAVFMNAGTHLGETQGALESAEVFSLSKGKLRTLESSDLKFSYRKNFFLAEDDIVYSARWKLLGSEPSRVKQLIDETLTRRKSTQPIDFPSCGSVFKNPKEKGKRAWEVMEALGLRGFKPGAAQFSEKHPNFIINLGAATSRDVKTLIDLAKKRADSELGIRLEEEVRYLGY